MRSTVQEAVSSNALRKGPRDPHGQFPALPTLVASSSIGSMPDGSAPGCGSCASFLTLLGLGLPSCTMRSQQQYRLHGWRRVDVLWVRTIRVLGACRECVERVLTLLSLPMHFHPVTQNGCCLSDMPISLDLAGHLSEVLPSRDYLQPIAHVSPQESSTSSFYTYLSDSTPPDPQFCHLGL